MARDLTTPMQAQLVSPVVSPIIFVSIAFKSSSQYLWSGVGDLPWNGITWKGIGELAEIGQITESGDQTAHGLSLTLSGIDNTLLTESLTDIQIGRPVSVWFGFFDSTNGVVADPYRIYQGGVDIPTVKTSVSTSKITLNVENKLNDQRRGIVTRLTGEDQRRRFPLDKGLDFVPQLADASWKWGG